MKRYLNLLIIILLSVFCAHAQSVSQAEAREAAQQFLNKQQKHLDRCARVVCEGNDTLLYIFNADNGFVMIAGDKRMPPVLAFSDRQRYNDEDVIPPVQMWMDQYCRQMAAVKSVDAPENSAWRQLQSRGEVYRDGSSVSPLMKSHWGQGTFYNYYCPRDFEGENYRVVTGCVATAMAQLIYYYRFPEVGEGSYSYLDSTYGVQSADYAQTHYDYNAMCDDPTSINPAISTLMHHCGVGVDMVYGPDGSGMYNHSAAYVLRTYFKFSPETQYVFRDSTDMDWDSLIVTHLHRNMPLYYAGWSDPNVNGHGFICDGYRMVDSNYYYHFNFGWEGDYDGYFYTNALNLISTHFNFAQELIINAYPDTSRFTYPANQPLTGTTTLTSLSGSFTDGSSTDDAYSPNMDYTWIIRPEEDYFSTIGFKIEYDVAGGDTLWISTNNSAISPVCITDSNSTLNVTWSCTEITVRFKTDDSTQSKGLRANYNANINSYCQEVANFTSQTGTIEDGSGNNPYLPYTSCRFRIILPSYSAIQVHIDYLDLEENKDFLHIFDNSPANDRLLASLTGQVSDTDMVFNMKRLAFVFETDEQNSADGFRLTYQGGHVGVDDFRHGQLSVFPNPAEDAVNIQAEETVTSVVLYDKLGRVVREIAPGDTFVRVDVNDLPSGVYLMRVLMSNRVVTKKIIKP